MRWGPAVAAVILLIAAPAFGQDVAASRRTASSCEGASTSDRLVGVSSRGEIELASGSTVKLAAIRLPDEAWREQALAWLRTRSGQGIALFSAGPLDRWGRQPARISLENAPSSFDLAQGLVENGLAIVDAGEAEVFCRPDLLALEVAARERGLGVWATDRYKPVPAEDIGRLRERLGGFTLVEGRIRSVGERRQRVYLNFGTNWAEDFTIIIPKRTWSILAGRGLSATTLKGQLIRARGLVEDWGGPALEIRVAEMIEVLGQGRGRH